MKDQIHHTLFFYGYIKCPFPVFQHLRLPAANEIVRFPVAGHHAGKFPAQLVDNKWIGIILNGTHVRPHRAHALAMLGCGFPGQVFGKPFGSIRIQHPLPR